MSSASRAEIPELKSAVQLAAELRGEDDHPIDPESDPKDSERYVFDFKYRDSRGKVWSGKFTNRILKVGQRRMLKILKAQLSGGVSVQALDADGWLLNGMLAHLQLSLERNSDFPKWAEDLEALYDERIIEALYEEVASHEAIFRRDGEGDRESTPSVSVGDR